MKTDQALLLPVGDDLYALPMAWCARWWRLRN